MPRLRVARPTNCSHPARYDVGLSPEIILYRIILPSAITCSGHRDSKVENMYLYIRLVPRMVESRN